MNKPKTTGAAGLKAAILAGGKGARLYPFTATFPKPLMPLGSISILDVLLDRLHRFKISDVTLCLGHLAELIQAYVNHRQSISARFTIDYVFEEAPTGTAGALSMLKHFDETFFVMNGDLLTNLDLNELAEFHRESGASLTIASHRREVKNDFGVIQVDSQCRVTDYLEKPKSEHLVSMGIYVYEPHVLEYIPYQQYLDFPDLVLKLIKDGRHVAAFEADCLWLDIGRPDDYAKAQKMVENNEI